MAERSRKVGARKKPVRLSRVRRVGTAKELLARTRGESKKRGHKDRAWDLVAESAKRAQAKEAGKTRTKSKAPTKRKAPAKRKKGYSAEMKAWAREEYEKGAEERKARRARMKARKAKAARKPTRRARSDYDRFMGY